MQTYKKKNKDQGKYYLEKFLKIAPLSHALWRAVEAMSFDQVKLKSPVLDLGCGWGEFAGVAFNRLEMGVDINDEDLQKAKDGKRYKNLKWADARELPFKKNTYGSVVSVSVMEHIEGGEKVISEVHRVLKKNGLFVFSVPTPLIKDNLLGIKVARLLDLKGVENKYWDLHRKAFKHVNLRPTAWWVEKLKKNGFEIEVAEGTLSPTVLRLDEVFLITAFPSQFGKLFFGKRLIMSAGVRSKVLPIFFSQFVKPDKNSEINMLFVARKK